MLPVLVQGQEEISLKGAAGAGEGRAGCVGSLSMNCNLIWPEFGMHPPVSAGQSLRECVMALPPFPLSITNITQFAELQIR